MTTFPNQDFQDLTTAIATYFDAIYFCDVEKLDAVFHEASSLFDADNGKIFVDPIASFRQDVANRPSPAARSQTRSDEIITIDYLSKISATVKLRLQAHESIFVDHLAFVKGEYGWKIVSKVWHLEGTAEVVEMG
ncbi:MAG: nuclear transport factor 2 family protein [Rhizobiaceae bacterium]